MADFETPPGPSGNDLVFLVIPLLIFCFLYCCRSESQSEDPADDAIAGWIPNPRAPTPSLSERRTEIEDNLIVRRVLAAQASTRKASSTMISEDDTSSSTRSVLDVVTKSDRTISSYVSAIMSMGSSSRKITKFSDPTSRSQSLSIHDERDDEDDKDDDKDKADDDKKDDAHSAATDEENPAMTNVALDTASTRPCEKKHRRKSDIFARSLAHSLRGTQNYDQPVSCDICLLDYEVDEEVAWSNNEGCIHAFHKDCITDWLLRNPKCPLCRRDYVVTTGGQS